MSFIKNIPHEQKVLIHTIGHMQALCETNEVKAPCSLNDLSKKQFDELEELGFQPTTPEIIQMSLAIQDKYDKANGNTEA